MRPELLPTNPWIAVPIRESRWTMIIYQMLYLWKCELCIAWDLHPQTIVTCLGQFTFSSTAFQIRPMAVAARLFGRKVAIPENALARYFLSICCLTRAQAGAQIMIQNDQWTTVLPRKNLSSHFSWWSTEISPDSLPVYQADVQYIPYGGHQLK